MHMASALTKISHGAVCILLSSILASGVFVTHALSDKVEDAHAFAMAIPVAAAAAGITEEAALATMGAILAAGFGFSLADYVGASSNDISSWSADQLDKAGDIWDELSKEVNVAWQLDQMEKDGSLNLNWSPDPNNPKDEPPKDPKDYDNSLFWKIIVLANTGFLGIDAISYFVDGFLNIAKALGIDREITEYPDLVLTDSDNSIALPVTSSFSDVFEYDNRNFVYIGETYTVSGASGSCFVSLNDGSSPVSVFDSYTIEKNRNGIYLSLHFAKDVPLSFVVADSESSRLSSGGSTPSSGNGISILVYPPSLYPVFPSFAPNLCSVSPSFALLLNSVYENTTEVSRDYEIADAPSGSLSTNSDDLKNWLASISSSTDAATGVKTNTVVTPNFSSATLPKDYTESVTKTDTELKPIEGDASKDDTDTGTGTITTPDDYIFPTSWTDGTINYRRIFPFFFLDDFYQLLDRWFPAAAYDGKFDLTFPSSLWGGKGKSKTVEFDASPFEPIRPFVYYGFLCLVFAGLVARLFTWWGGFTTSADGK